MPSIKENQELLKHAIETGSVVPAVNPAETAPVVPQPVRQNPFQRGPLPAIMVQSPDQQRQWQIGPIPSARIPPTAPASNPNTGATSASQAIVVARSQGLLLETNNQPNADQAILNLIAGTNTTLSADSQGGVTIGSTGGASDGLIHGDKIWDVDSAVVFFRDDFTYGSFSSSGGQFNSELEWVLYVTTGAPAISRRQGIPPNIGAISILNTGTASSAAAFLQYTNSATYNTPWPLLDYPSWKAVFVFAFDWPTNPASINFATTQKSFYCGLYSNSQVGSIAGVRPPVFIGCRFDTDPTAPAISDTHFKLEAVVNLSNATLDATRNNTQGTVVDTGVTPVAGVYHRLEIQCVAAGVVTMSFDGSAPSTFTIPNYVAGSTVSGAGESVQKFAGNNLTRVNAAASASLGAPVFGEGSKVTIAGSATPANNGARTLAIANGGDLFSVTQAGEANDFSASPISVTGKPGLFPFWIFGNDTQAAPTAGTTSLNMDFFAFVWNPGTGGGSGTPVSTKNRYW